MISRIHKNGATLTFRLHENVSVANALRRTILADIETPVLRDVRISKNTSRFTNELIAQRLGCVPVVSQDPSIVGMQVTLAVKNTSEEMLVVTTEDLVATDHTLFPPAIYGEKEWYIDLLRLRPAVANIAGEEIALTCVVGMGTAKESGQFNVASTCSYAMTQDQAASDAAFAQQQDESKENWNLLEAKRFVEPDSFDFIIQTVGVFANQELVVKACDCLIQSLHGVTFEIKPSLSTMKDCHDLVIPDGDYTIGKLLEYEVVKEHGKTVSYVTFLKQHPHDAAGILRVATIGEVDLTVLVTEAARRIAELFVKIKHKFGGKMEPELQADLEQFKATDIESKREILKSKGRAAAETADEETLDEMAAAYSEEVAVKRIKKKKAVKAAVEKDEESEEKKKAAKESVEKKKKTKEDKKKTQPEEEALEEQTKKNDEAPEEKIKKNC